MDRMFANSRTSRLSFTSDQDVVETILQPETGPAPHPRRPSNPILREVREVAKEYDKDFLKKHGEDLDTTLIFVSPT